MGFYEKKRKCERKSRVCVIETCYNLPTINSSHVIIQSETVSYLSKLGTGISRRTLVDIR